MTAEQRQERARAAHEEEAAKPRPIDAIDSVWIEDMTYMEVRDAMKAGKTTALLFAGSTEQNGPYLPGGKDYYHYSPPLGVSLVPISGLDEHTASVIWFVLKSAALLAGCLLMPVALPVRALTFVGVAVSFWAMRDLVLGNLAHETDSSVVFFHRSHIRQRKGHSLFDRKSVATSSTRPFGACSFSTRNA